MRRFNWMQILLPLLGFTLDLVPRLIIAELNNSALPVKVDSPHTEGVFSSTIVVPAPSKRTEPGLE